jgi:glycosyltransferase involved in cell wall biosynthesis
VAIGYGSAVPSEPVPLPAVSVVLSAYNGERFLREQLDSLARQRVLPAELVVCDDCSWDGTAAILDDFARSAPFPMRVFRNECNLGFTVSFLTAAELCGTPLIAFCDQDDVWEESKIGVCARFFADHPDVVLVVHAAQPVDEHLRPVGDVYPPLSGRRVAPLLGADPWMTAPGFAMVFDAALLQVADWRHRPPSRDLDGHPMDFDEWVYFLSWAVGEIGFIGESLARYRQHGGNLFGAPAHDWRARLRKLLNEDFATPSGRSAVSRAYVAFLEQARETRSREDGEVDMRLSAAAGRWRTYEQLSRRRDQLYDAEMFTERLHQLGTLIASRAYRGRETSGLGRLALMRDLREMVLPGRETDRTPV